MIISVHNYTNGAISDEKVQVALRAVNRQIHEDFAPYWGTGARLRLEGRSLEKPDVKQAAIDMHGDAVIYLWDEVDEERALGVHSRNHQGIPYGFVFKAVARRLPEPWTVTLSHEALEMIVNPEMNLLVRGPRPGTREREKQEVFHWYEVCDAVQAETYEIDGVAVSNFLLPLYFTRGEELGGRNDFLGRRWGDTTLRSFRVNPGGYIGFYDPETRKNGRHAHAGDAVAARRAEIKESLGCCRRSTLCETEPPAVRAGAGEPSPGD